MVAWCYTKRGNMAYTVKQVAQLSGVSVRTLHWYDEIGLLKPTFHGENGYRYYEEKELLTLQQILFFRELGVRLDDIQNLLQQEDFDQVKALQAHKQILEKDINRKHELIATIDKTILHLRGNTTMADKELYYGFDPQFPKDKVYEFKSTGSTAENTLSKFKKADVNWSPKEWEDFKNTVDTLNQSIAALITQGLPPEDKAAQALIKQHYDLQTNFHALTQEAYTALIDMYEAENSPFQQFFDVYHPKMRDYMCQAMRHYAKQSLP